ncbi:membrane protein [Tepiditoga spiralis]|uniref:Membrane protein n=1 Tax=Tepiditoga spiralis TaxID=2108365 RepID=A0A7G1G5A8_9BACT|nr:DMT family transporter [Tepiditoga spiralis]BBE31581.1 membrane protein [Tepiditoga spiralis]
MVRAFFALLMVTFLWGSTFPFIKMAVNGESVYLYLSLRFWLAGILSMFLWKKHSLKYGLIIGIFISLGQITQTIGLTLTTASKSGFITSLYIVLVPVFAYLIEKEKPTLMQIIAFPISILGSYFLSGGVKGFNVGDILTVLCAVFYALSVVYITKYSKIVPESSLLSYQFIAVAIMNTALAFTSPGGKVSIPLILVVIYTAVFSTIIATLFQSKYQKILGNNMSAFVFIGEPIFAAFFAFLILKETLSVKQFLGASIMIISLIIGTIPSKNKEKITPI